MDFCGVEAWASALGLTVVHRAEDAGTVDLGAGKLLIDRTQLGAVGRAAALLRGVGRSGAREGLVCSEERPHPLAVGAVLVTENRVAWACPLAVEALGRPLEELVEHDFWQWVHPEDRQRSGAAVACNVARRAAPSDHENRWANPGGGWRRLLWSGSPPDSRGLIHCTVRLIGIESGDP